MKSTEITTVCPYCRDAHPLATSIKLDSDDSPSDGDFSICFECAGVSIFDGKADGLLRRPTTTEAQEIADDYDIQSALAAWRDMHGRMQ